MIRYLRHDEIDKNRWDRCIRDSVNSLVYGFSWYLDLISPGWEGLAEDDYVSVFPLTHRKKFGIRYLAQPFFAQQLGIFSTGLLTPGLVAGFLDAIPGKYRFAEIHLNYMNKVGSGDFEVTMRLNHELELICPYDEISGQYSRNTRRNIRKAMDAGVEVWRKMSVDEMITLFRNNFGRHEGKLGYRDYITIESLMSDVIARTSGIIIGAGNRRDNPDAGAFFINDRNRFIMLVAASDYATRENGAMFLLIDAFIREHAGQLGLLDFEGGNNPGPGRFYKGFGAKETAYPFLRISRIPFFRQRR